MIAGWQTLGLVALGGALGAVGRYWLGGALLRRFGDDFPWDTLAVNLVGAFAVGFVAIWLQGRGPAAAHWRAFLLVGVLGALTTWSALMLECLLFAKSGRGAALAGYLGLMLALSLALVWLGARTAEALRVS